MDTRNEHRKTCAVCLAIDLQTLENALEREITQEEYQNATGEEAAKFEEIIAGSHVSTKHPDDKHTEVGKRKKAEVNPELKKIRDQQAKAGLKSLNKEMVRLYGKDN